MHSQERYFWALLVLISLAIPSFSKEKKLLCPISADKTNVVVRTFNSNGVASNPIPICPGSEWTVNWPIQQENSLKLASPTIKIDTDTYFGCAFLSDSLEEQNIPENEKRFVFQVPINY